MVEHLQISLAEAEKQVFKGILFETVINYLQVRKGLLVFFSSHC